MKKKGPTKDQKTPSADSAVASGAVCSVIAKRCRGCGTCVSVCTYGAVRLRTTRSGNKAIVDQSLCKGDGLCCSLCATGAIVLRDSPDEEIIRQIDVALGLV
ncbi:MAG: 4Fe-4S binding protein [Deltaproteobacteria bacterium]|nr:4Fe-4S binding protein [Deltaproteobacteria bacterium]